MSVAGLSRLWRAAYLLLTCVALLWAGNAIVGRSVRELVPPFTLSFLRWTGATLVLLPFAWRHLVADRATIRVHWRAVLILGLFGVACFNTFFYTALRHTSATNGVLIQSATPATILLLDRIIWKRRTSWVQIAATLLCVAGVAVIIGKGDLAILLHMKVGLGEALALIAVFCWATYSSLLRLRPAVHPLSFLLATFPIGIVALLPFVAWEMAQGQVVTWNGTSVGGIFYVALFPSVIAYLLYNRAVELVGPSKSSQFVNLMPLFGALLATLLLGEALMPYHAVGMVLILTGIIWFARIKPPGQPAG